MTILEAMAASKPVVATRVGAIPNVINHGENGLLVEPRDKDGLRNAIASLLADPDRCHTMGVKAHEWVSRNYTSEAMALKYRQLYDEILEKAELAAIPAQRQDHANVDARRA